jgi:hypothetical protein
MQQYTGNFPLLINKLDEFIRKYYINQFLRGIIFTASSLLIGYLISALSEYFFYFSPTVRTIIFYSYIFASLFTFIFWVFIPLFHYYRLGKIISYEKASEIIGTHFKNVDDKLLNVLQLKNMPVSETENALIEAGINQKINSIKNIPFLNAINLRINNRYLVKYFVPALIVLFIIIITSPRVLTESTKRLVNYSNNFERAAPFKFIIKNKKLQSFQNSDFNLIVETSGEILPEESYLISSDIKYKLTKKSKNIFEYTFSNLQKNVEFVLSANDFKSKKYTIEVISKPAILDFKIDLIYPSYLKMKNESISNSGDITIPEGTEITWNINTKNTSLVLISTPIKKNIAKRIGENLFTVRERLSSSIPYSISVINEKNFVADSVSYNLTVVADQYPSINVESIIDSSELEKEYYYGAVSDDYGITKLELKYKIASSENLDTQEKTISIPVSKDKEDKFSTSLNFNEMNLKPGESVSYYFEVWDNDGVNDSKSTKSSLKTHRIPSLNELENLANKQNEDLKNNLEKTIKEIKNINKELKDAQKELLEKKNLNWEDKKKLQDLLSNQKETLKKIDEIQKDFNNNIKQQNEFQKNNPDLIEKQKMLQELSEQIMSPEMKNLLKKLEELMDKLNKDQTLDKLKANEKQTQQAEKELDRMLSLFKQLEFEQKFNSVKDKLNELSKKQDELNSKTESKQPDNQSSKEEQSDINSSFDKLQEDLKSLEDLNKELENPLSLPKEMEQQSESIDKDLENSLNELNKGNNSKAGQSQKSASKKMQDMAKSMDEFMQGSESEQSEEDLKAIRQIIENLVSVSFKQEELLNKTKNANIYNPNYLQIIKDQNRLGDDIQMIKDSIQALAKRQFQIKSYVDEQISLIDENIEKTTKNLTDRQTNIAASNQQFVMTSVNNLALIFDEQMKQMQQQMMQGKKPGSGQCKKPGGTGLGEMSKMQKQLNDKISKMAGINKNGQKPGEKPGQKSGNGQQGLSQQFAEMAAQQAAIRDALKQLSDQLAKEGNSGNSALKSLQELMDKTERDLANKNITNETLKRQQDILTRLLESDKAFNEREWDDKKKSNTSNEITNSVPPSIEDYLKKRQNEIELFKTLPPNLNPFYKTLVEDFYNKIPN